MDRTSKQKLFAVLCFTTIAQGCTLESDTSATSPYGPRESEMARQLTLPFEKKGDYAKALQLRESVYALELNTTAPGSPNQLAAMDTMLGYYKGLGQFEKAQPLCERFAQAVVEINTEHPWNAVPPVIGLARNLTALKRYDEAASALNRAMALVTANTEKNAVPKILILQEMAELDCKRNRLDKAQAEVDDALRLAEKCYGKNGLLLGGSLCASATVANARGSLQQADKLFSRAVDLLEGRDDEDKRSWEIPDTLVDLATVRLREHRAKDAQTLLSQAIELTNSETPWQFGDSLDTLCRAYTDYRTILLATGRSKEADQIAIRHEKLCIDALKYVENNKVRRYWLAHDALAQYIKFLYQMKREREAGPYEARLKRLEKDLQF